MVWVVTEFSDLEGWVNAFEYDLSYSENFHRISGGIILRIAVEAGCFETEYWFTRLVFHLQNCFCGR